MSDDPLTYLLDRFATDATTLRARAEQLAGKPAPAQGPDADDSRRMAEACEDVLALLNDITVEDDEEMLDALEALGPELQTLAERSAEPFLRSVYAGAAMRLDEVVRRARGDDDAPDDDGDDD